MLFEGWNLPVPEPPPDGRVDSLVSALERLEGMDWLHRLRVGPVVLARRAHALPAYAVQDVDARLRVQYFPYLLVRPPRNQLALTKASYLNPDSPRLLDEE